MIMDVKTRYDVAKKPISNKCCSFELLIQGNILGGKKSITGSTNIHLAEQLFYAENQILE